MATHSDGISALQLQKQLGLGSYKTAWLLATKLRRAMVAPEHMEISAIECPLPVSPEWPQPDVPPGLGPLHVRVVAPCKTLW